MFGNTLIVVHIMPLSVIYILFLVGLCWQQCKLRHKKFYNIDNVWKLFSFWFKPLSAWPQSKCWDRCKLCHYQCITFYFFVGYANSDVNYVIKSFITLTPIFENFFHFELSHYWNDLSQNVRYIANSILNYATISVLHFIFSGQCWYQCKLRHKKFYNIDTWSLC
jgi:hypothetical protein